MGDQLVMCKLPVMAMSSCPWHGHWHGQWARPCAWLIGHGTAMGMSMAVGGMAWHSHGLCHGWHGMSMPMAGVAGIGMSMSIGVGMANGHWAWPSDKWPMEWNGSWFMVGMGINTIWMEMLWWVGAKDCWCINYNKEWLVCWEMAFGGSCPIPPSWCTTNTHMPIMR